MGSRYRTIGMPRLRAIDATLREWESQQLDRRRLVKRAAALGLSTAALAMLVG
jgi:hypothetical protein